MPGGANRDDEPDATDLPDESVLQLEPLPTGGERSDAARLFVDRVHRARSRYDLEVDDPAVAELCRRLDGVPLALEVAAGRAAALGAAAVSERLGSILGSLGDLVAWSVELLGAPARALLAALSVFQGEFDLDAAEAVGVLWRDEPVSVMLSRLVDTSLVATSALTDTASWRWCARSRRAGWPSPSSSASCAQPTRDGSQHS